jgi:CRISPR-associated helicase Cas3
MVAGNLPDALDIPTGLGKTAVIPIWLLAIATQSPLTLPRRLIYVVNRRTVVDQATDVAQRIRAKLSAVHQVHQALATLSADAANPLAISTLRGEYQDTQSRFWPISYREKFAHARRTALDIDTASRGLTTSSEMTRAFGAWCLASEAIRSALQSSWKSCSMRLGNAICRSGSFP